MARSSDPTKAARWRDHLAHWQASGLRVRDFCDRHGLCEQSFYRWRRVLAERDRTQQPDPAAPPRFVAVAIQPRGPDGRIEVLLVSGQRVAVSPGFDPATLAQVVAVLEGSSC